MLQSFKKILNSKLQAKDGKIGHLDDLLFDDEQWTIRYLVVKTGGLLHRDRVLISPLGVAEIDGLKQNVKLNLTRQQIELSPDVDTDAPVFRQMEKRYFDYYSWPYYWDDVGLLIESPKSSLMIGKQLAAAQSKGNHDQHTNGDPHLRSCRIVSGYAIETEDTPFGHVEDFLIEDGTWKICNLAVNGKTWWPDQNILISAQSVTAVDWFGHCIKLSMTKKEIESTPEFDPGL